MATGGAPGPAARPAAGPDAVAGDPASVAQPAPELSVPTSAVPPSLPVHPTRGPNEIALGAVLLAVVVGLALVGQDHWRRGLLLIGIGLLAGAGLRLVLPARVVGLLAVRGRVFDAVVLGLLGAAVIVLTSSVPLPPNSG